MINQKMVRNLHADLPPEFLLPKSRVVSRAFQLDRHDWRSGSPNPRDPSNPQWSF